MDRTLKVTETYKKGRTLKETEDIIGKKTE
jgi:hypothetical protein